MHSIQNPIKRLPGTRKKNMKIRFLTRRKKQSLETNPEMMTKTSKDFRELL